MSKAAPGAGALLWCCAGCIRGSDDSTEYYTFLGLTPSATQDEVADQPINSYIF